MKTRLTRIASAGLVFIGTVFAAEEPVSFNSDVAPILFKNCAPCHHPKGSAPFSLLTYAEAQKRARQISEVTRSRYMPPWLPAAGHEPFVGERRLTEEQINTLHRWQRGGAVQGEPEDLPSAPTFDRRWTLGKPDLVLTMPQPYELPSEGIDIYRNFVIPGTVKESRWIEAVEFDAGNPRIVHHGRMLVDRTSSSRDLDARDRAVGFDGMVWGRAEPPDGMLLGWTPGKVPLPGIDGLAWRLDPGMDLVLQLHLIPTGRRETIQSSVALYFADKPPERRSHAFVLGSREIDIPAGSSTYEVSDEYTLPVEVDLIGVYPHAHYLGKTIDARAELPDGTERRLIHIPDWDFNWQDEYRYATPLRLPAGTKLSLRIRFDNSEKNERNPFIPPRRVTYGALTTDEMAEMMLQVVPASRSDLEILERDFSRHTVKQAIAFRRKRIRDNPRDAQNHAALGSTFLYLELYDEAAGALEEAVRLAPKDANARNNLAYARRMQGRLGEALRHYRVAVRLEPEFVVARSGLANILRDTGKLEEAAEQYLELLKRKPDTAELHHQLGRTLEQLGRKDEARRYLDEARRLGYRD